MSAAKHTSGPWMWDSDPYVEGRVRFRVAATGRTIAQTYYSSSDPQAIADTRLIAAAPELLAVCQRFAEFATPTNPWSYPLGSRKELLAVIAKALGEPQ